MFYTLHNIRLAPLLSAVKLANQPTYAKQNQRTAAPLRAIELKKSACIKTYKSETKVRVIICIWLFC